MPIIARPLVVTGVTGSRRRDYERAVRLIEEGAVDVAPLVTHRFGVADATQQADALDELRAIHARLSAADVDVSVAFKAVAGKIDRGGGPNDRPMWENACRYHAQLSGAPASVFDAIDTDVDDDVAARSRFAKWDHEPGEDAVYVAWHSNAPIETGTS